MNFILVLILAVVVQFQIVKMKTYYKGEGVIFDNTVRYPLKHDDFLNGYTPEIEDVVEAEKMFSTGYYQYRKAVAARFPNIRYVVSDRFKDPRAVIKKYYQYNRQYAGFINKSNDTIIYLSAMNFAKREQAEKDFAGWKEKVVIDAVTNENDQLNLEVNITKNTIVQNWDRKLGENIEKINE
jgi:hypothetical protein